MEKQEKLETIVKLLSKSMFYEYWKWETPNQRVIEMLMREVGYSIATSNSDNNAKDSASYITERCGGDRAVAEACLHILQVFFTSYKPQI